MPAIKPNLCSCIICRKETSQLGIQTHYQRSHTESDKWQNSTKPNKEKAAKTLANNQSNYIKNPRYCLHCNKHLSFEERNNQFCSKSCSASYGNARKDYTKFKPGPQKFIGPKLPTGKDAIFLRSISGEYCELHIITCKVCKEEFCSSGIRKCICNTCKMNSYRSQDLYRFEFNVYDYPDLFDLEDLNKIGWYSQGGKSRKPKNINGYSRDHRVSQSEAKTNNYNRYYITHPINCQLMRQSENSRKHSRSSISYEDLIKEVNAYDGARDEP